MSDALSLFTILWSHIAVIQCVKVYHIISSRPYNIFTEALTTDLLLLIVLAVSILVATINPSSSFSLLFLCFSHIVSLACQGSQSNHVIMGLVIASAVVMSYSNDRRRWQRAASGSMYLLLIIVYFLPGIDKMNKDWFDPTVSCASLFSSGFLSMVLPIPRLGAEANSFATFMIATAPYQAIIIEMGLPLLLITWRAAQFGPFGSSSVSSWAFKILIVIAAAFHLMICLPLPPMSVYPFSMVMVPMYALMLPPNSIRLLFQVTEKHTILFGMVIAAVAIAVQVAVKGVLAGEPMPLEYPPYGLWTPSIVWNLIVWSLLVYAAWAGGVGGVAGRSPAQTRKLDDDAKTDRPLRMRLLPVFEFRFSGIFLSAFLAFIGTSPYTGFRNYPALAMFSNLRTEGGNDDADRHSYNHLFMPAALDYVGYQKQTATIHDTNLKSLRHFQVNLAEYFAEHTKKFNAAHGVKNEFWISPPSWTPPDNRSIPFVEYSIPLFELRRHLSKALLSTSVASRSNNNNGGSDFFVNFSVANEPVARILNSSDTLQLETDGLYQWLSKPLTYIEATVFRYRSFDSSYSPCRH